jgi:hypothetical protein
MASEHHAVSWFLHGSKRSRFWELCLFQAISFTWTCDESHPTGQRLVTLSQDRAPIPFIPNEMRYLNDLVPVSTVTLASAVRLVCLSPALIEYRTQKRLNPNVTRATHEQTNIPRLHAR